LAGKILPNTGTTANRARLSGRLKGAAAGLFGFVFWLIVAAVFPYGVLAPYWPAAEQWAPLVLYAVAVLNLIKAVFHLGQLGRLGSQAPSLRTSMRQIQAIIDKDAGRKDAGRKGAGGKGAGGKAERPRDKPRTSLPPAKSTPTVQRMR